ncbi:MAG: PQQ-binding-like beta-propeller repeat protein [Acidobacteriota bacterium]
MNLMLILFLLLTPLTSESRWTAFRGTGDSHSTARNLPLEWSDKKNLAWSVNLTGYGQSSPVVWGNKIFLTSTQGENKERLFVSCFYLKSGKKLWEKKQAATYTMKDANTVSKAAPTPAVDERRVYAFFESGDLFAFDHKGELLWQRKLAGEYGAYKTNHGLGSSLALTEQAVIVFVVHQGHSYLLAVDKKSGRNLWMTDLAEGGGWTSPIIASHQGSAQILISVNGRVAAFEAATGRELWSVKGLKGNNIPSPSIGDDLVVIGSSDKGSNLAIQLGGAGDVSETRVRWRAKEATSSFCSPLVYKGLVYFVNKVGAVFCLDLKTGEQLWQTRIESDCWASPLAAGDHIYFFTVEGVTEVFRAGTSPERIARNELSLNGGRIYGIAAVDSALLIRCGRRLIKLSER